MDGSYIVVQDNVPLLRTPNYEYACAYAAKQVRIVTLPCVVIDIDTFQTAEYTP